MADVKWIKITTDIFDDEKIKMIESLPSADSIIVIWFKLLCLAGKQNNGGIFFLNDRIPYTDEMLAAVFRREVSQIRLALQTFQQFEMIDVVDGVVTIPNWSKYQSALESYEKRKERDREYQRKKREQQRADIEEKSTKKSSDGRTTLGRFCSYSLSDNSKSYSYSFSSSKNVDNLNYLLQEKRYKYSEKLENNPELLKSIEEWMAYKDEKKPKEKNHYTEISLKKLLTQIVNAVDTFGTFQVIDLIDMCIANGYQGIIFSMLEEKKAGHKAQADQGDWQNGNSPTAQLGRLLQEIEMEGNE